MKLKTNKALSKRIKKTRNKKLLIRRGHQNHFNAKNPGKITRRKRTKKIVVKALDRTMKVREKMPYNQ
jgi:ribosomal protein L35